LRAYKDRQRPPAIFRLKEHTETAVSIRRHIYMMKDPYGTGKPLMAAQKGKVGGAPNKLGFLFTCGRSPFYGSEKDGRVPQGAKVRVRP